VGMLAERIGSECRQHAGILDAAASESELKLRTFVLAGRGAIGAGRGTPQRCGPDAESGTGYKIDVGPFPSWAKTPEW
jgi:hypothetical protein